MAIDPWGSTLQAPQQSRPLEETLRTIGLSLEAAAPRRARLRLSDDGVLIEAPGSYGIRLHTWSDLRILSESWRGQRRPEPHRRLASDPWSLTRWSVLLRATGALLEGRRFIACQIEAGAAYADPAQDAYVLAVADNQQVVETLAVREWILRRRWQAGTARPDFGASDRAASRAWWTRWLAR
jgi:hypothetical protein